MGGGFPRVRVSGSLSLSIIKKKKKKKINYYTNGNLGTPEPLRTWTQNHREDGPPVMMRRGEDDDYYSEPLQQLLGIHSRSRFQLLLPQLFSC